MVLTTINKDKTSFRGLIIGKVIEGKTVYTIAVSAHGGIWYKGGWIMDKWHPLSEKAFRERFPKLADESLNAPRLAEIRAQLDKEGLLCF